MGDLNKYEYIWLDGYQPEPSMRSKIKVTDEESAPGWSFDGSSTHKQRVEALIVFYFQCKLMRALYILTI